MPRLPKVNSSNHHPRPKNNYHHLQQNNTGWDVPPPALSPNEASSFKQKETNPNDEQDSGGSVWRTRPLVWTTPRKLATLHLPGGREIAKSIVDDIGPLPRNQDDSDNLGFSEPRGSPLTGDAVEVRCSDIDSSTSSVTTCPPLLWNESYLVVATLGGEIHLFGNILPPSDTLGMLGIMNGARSNSPDSSTDTLSTLAPLATLTLPHDATIVALQPLKSTDDPQSTFHELGDGDPSSSVFLALSTEGNIYRIRLDRRYSNNGGKIIDPNQLASYSKRTPTILTELDHTIEGKKKVPSSTFYQHSLLLQASWTTEECGITSCTLLPMVNYQKSADKQGSNSSCEKLELFIGYDSGHLESWTLDVASAQQLPIRLWRALVDREERQSSVKAIGSLPRQLSPITSRVNSISIDSQDKRHSEEKDESLSTKKSTIIEEREKRVVYDLVVTLQDMIGDNFPRIRVLDVSAIRHHMLSISSLTSRNRADLPQQDENQRVEVRPISLAQFHLHPDPGMELIGTTNPYHSSAVSAEPQGHQVSMAAYRSRKPSLVHIASTGTNQIVPLHGGSNLQQQHKKGSEERMRLRCGVALSNGTVAALSAGWGIEDDTNQVLLSYPAIGLGRILLPQHGEERMGSAEPASPSLPQQPPTTAYQGQFQEEYMVCCLRAGTCYFIPTTNNGNEDELRDIAVMPYPHDKGTDTTSLYVQTFTAGSLRNQFVHNSTNTFNTEQVEPQHAPLVPVLVFVWPGGLIDLYSCEWKPGSPSHPVGKQYAALKTSASVLSPPEQDQFLAELFSQSTQQHNCQSQSFLGNVLQILESTGLEELFNHQNLDDSWLQARQEILKFKARPSILNEQPSDVVIADSAPTTLSDLRDRPMLCKLLLQLALKESLL